MWRYIGKLERRSVRMALLSDRNVFGLAEKKMLLQYTFDI